MADFQISVANSRRILTIFTELGDYPEDAVTIQVFFHTGFFYYRRRNTRQALGWLKQPRDCPTATIVM